MKSKISKLPAPIVGEEMVIKKDNLLTTLPSLDKEYKITFDMFITKHIVDNFRTVVHFTVGGNNDKYGDRTPGVWTFKKRLSVASAVSGNRNKVFMYPKVLEEGKWTNVEISQSLVDDKANRAFIFLRI